MGGEKEVFFGNDRMELLALTLGESADTHTHARTHIHSITKSDCVVIIL